MAKDFNLAQCNFLFFILDLSNLKVWRGIYLKLKSGFWKKSSVPDLILNYNFS